MDLATLPGYVPGFRDELSIRELGGMTGADGRVVRHGLLFRGSALVGLTDAERQRVDELGIRFLLDLRATGEVIDRADYVPAGAEYLRVSGMYDETGQEVDFSPSGIARMQETIAKKQENFMGDLYVSMMFGNPAVHELVGRFARRQAPLYFHCTAGKDRTGVCAAVLLMLLGVSDDDIVREFLLTNEYRASIIHMPPEKLPADLTPEQRERWADMNGVREQELRGALSAVDARHATREEYFEQEFGYDVAQLAALRDHYLS